MAEYRFQLRKYRNGGKLTCPACGRTRCFTPYIDTLGEITFPEDVGRCDHINRCGYHKKPKDYFAEHPQAKTDWRNAPKAVAIPKPVEKPTSYIDYSFVEKAMGHYEFNPFYRFLASRFGKEEIERVFLLYKVGTGRRWGGCAVFWQIDGHNRVRTGKLMKFDEVTGHRIKIGPAITWAHSVLRLPDFNICQCFFGEHLLAAYPQRKVMIVESEKTAIIGTLCMPQFLWLASGGINGCLNAQASKVLAGRDVLLLPDLNGEAEWDKKMKMLEPICQSVAMSRWLADSATQEQRSKGLDVADFLLEEYRIGEASRALDPLTCTDQELFEYWKETKPGFREFAEKLQLECVTPNRRPMPP